LLDEFASNIFTVKLFFLIFFQFYQMAEIYLSLGSNIEDRKLFINTAEQLIEQEIGDIKAKSSLYETEPWGFIHHVNFYNRVLQINTELLPQELLTICLQIEMKMGRIRSKNKYEARCIDIDILFYENQIVRTGKLSIPHPSLHLRKFILEPLFEIAPDFEHPVIHKRIRQLIEECDDSTGVIKI
jgi:2-amino-4-hydroxy-6-hydroxymethyldihydropteridine diphosphokinase